MADTGEPPAAGRPIAGTTTGPNDTGPARRCGFMRPVHAAARTKGRRRLRCGHLVAALVVSVVAGCGSSANGPTTVATHEITGIGDLRVTPEYIRRAGPSSPGGTLLRWWRAVQLDQEAEAVAAYATPVDTHLVPHEIAHLTYYVKRSRPNILKTRIRDGRARVATVVNGAQFDQSDPHKVLLLSHTPASFQLVRQSGRWKLADDAYLKQQFRAEFGQG